MALPNGLTSRQLHAVARLLGNIEQQRWAALAEMLDRWDREQVVLDQAVATFLHRLVGEMFRCVGERRAEEELDVSATAEVAGGPESGPRSR